MTASDFEDARHVYRDVMGMREAFPASSRGGRVAILDVGRATLELADPGHASYIDELKVGRRVAGHVRVGFEVSDATRMTERLAKAGARVIAEPIPTPWGTLNSRIDGPADLHVTLFEGSE